MKRFVWESDQWPDWSWDADTVLPLLSRVRRAQGRLFGRVEPVLESEAMRFTERALVTETIANSAVEGEFLDRTLVRSSVVRRLGLESGGLPEPGRREQAVVDVLLDATQNYAIPLTADRLFSWQAALFPTGYSGLRKLRVGGWRDVDPMSVVSGSVGREKVHYVAPPSDRVPREMERLLCWWNSPPGELDGLIRAALGHLWFLSIHPFEDGNGRLARVLTEMALCQDENSSSRLYSLSGRILERRNDYYEVLERVQRSQGDATDWLLWFLESLESAIQMGDQLLDGVLARHRFWLQHRTTEMNARQLKALERLLEAGPGGFEGGMTTRKYASLNRVSKPTAYRELSDLAKRGVLTTEGSGRSVRYEVNWP